MTAAIDTHGMMLGFGKKFRGVRVTQVPIGYLRWMVREQAKDDDGFDWAAVAAAELGRRQVPLDVLDATEHAVNRFSQRFIARWLTDRFSKVPATQGGEGIVTYIQREATRAWEVGNILSHGPDVDGGLVFKKVYREIVWVFHCGDDGKPQALKTVLEREDKK